VKVKDLRLMLSDCDDDADVVFYSKEHGAFDINAMCSRKHLNRVEISDKPLPEERIAQPKRKPIMSR